MMNRAVRAICMLTVCVAICAVFGLRSTAAAYSYNYVSLGDSIAGGYGLSDPESERYSAVAGGSIKASVKSYTVNGMTSDNFILALRSGAYDEALRDADIVTVSIGSNDLLKPVMSQLSSQFGAYMNGSEFSFSVSGTTVGIYAGFKSILTGNAELEAACAAFPKKLSTIASLLCEKAPDAFIYFNNIYNPYTAFKIQYSGTTPIDLGALADTYITKMNQSFAFTSPRCRAVDVYAAFAWAYSNGMSPVNAGIGQNLSVSIDPHPNATGQKLIAETIVKCVNLPQPSDIDGHWAEMYIKKLIKYHVYDGIVDDKFLPDDSITRGKFVSVLGRLAGVNISKYSLTPFADVSTDQYYSPYVTWAAWNDIVTGVGNYRFAPDREITREEMAVIIGRLISVFAFDTSGAAKTAPSFTDAQSISDWATDSVGLVARLGLMKGDSEGRFLPKSGITNAEVAAILYRINQMWDFYNIIK